MQEAGRDLKHIRPQTARIPRKPGQLVSAFLIGAGGKTDVEAAGGDQHIAALHEAGAMKPADEKYRRGVKFLVGSQKEDGSWHVATRSKPVQKYFESGFPHGKDQFISISATGWAVAALALSSPR